MLRCVYFSSMLAFLSIPLLGCGRSTSTTKVEQQTVREAVDPWPKATTTLRKEPDMLTAKRVLNELNSALAASPSVEQPTHLDAEVEKAIQADFRLNPQELKEIHSLSFTSLDAHYLADSLYIRDAARWLDAMNLPPVRRAKVAFDWVCRQMLLRPWQQPLSPTLALSRGAGSGLDRAYAFIVLCRQLGIDAYLIGQAGAYDWKSIHVPAGLKEPKGPFWAVGVRIEKEIYLYEPWRGESFPSDKVGTPATLAEVRAKPEMLAVWFDDKTKPWDVSKSDLQAAEVYLAVPLSSLAGRMKVLESKLAGDLGVDLFIDWKSTFANALAAAEGVRVRAWNVPEDVFSLTRIAQAYLSSTDGGYGLTLGGLGGASLLNAYMQDLIPQKALSDLPKGITNPDAKARFLGMAFGQYAEQFVKPPTPREKLQRGQFAEVTQQLVRSRDEFSARGERLRTDPGSDAAVAAFIEKLNGFYDEQIPQLRSQGRNGAEIEQVLVNFLKSQLYGLSATLDGPLCQAVVAEATLLLAISTQERAERAQLTYERLQQLWEQASDADKKSTARNRDEAKQNAIESWNVARDWWVQYEPHAQYQDGIYPGRAKHAQEMTARTTAFQRLYR